MSKRISIKHSDKEIEFSFDGFEELKNKCNEAFQLNGTNIKSFKVKKGDANKAIKTEENLFKICESSVGIPQATLALDKNQVTSQSNTIDDQSYENYDKTTKLIDEKFSKMEERIKSLEENKKKTEDQLDQLISMFMNQSDNKSNNKTEPQQNKIEEKPKEYLLEWLTDKIKIQTERTRDYPFLIKARNCGKEAWPQIEIYSLPKPKSIQIIPEKLQTIIQSTEQLTKKISLKTQGKTQGTYEAYIQLRDWKTKANIGDPLKLAITILSEMSEEKKACIMFDFLKAFPQKSKDEIEAVCIKHKFDYDSVWEELNPSTILNK